MDNSSIVLDGNIMVKGLASHFFSNMYFSLILGQAPITANLENDYRCKDIKLESRLMLKNIETANSP